jgi:hypothetical protein
LYLQSLWLAILKFDPKSKSVGLLQIRMVREGHTNFILLADNYKVGHHIQYPPNTTTIHCYFESRGGKFDTTGTRTNRQPEYLY